MTSRWHHRIHNASYQLAYKHQLKIIGFLIMYMRILVNLQVLYQNYIKGNCTTAIGQQAYSYHYSNISTDPNLQNCAMSLNVNYYQLCIAQGLIVVFSFQCCIFFSFSDFWKNGFESIIITSHGSRKCTNSSKHMKNKSFSSSGIMIAEHFYEMRNKQEFKCDEPLLFHGAWGMSRDASAPTSVPSSFVIRHVHIISV